MVAIISITLVLVVEVFTFVTRSGSGRVRSIKVNRGIFL